MARAKSGIEGETAAAGAKATRKRATRRTQAKAGAAKPSARAAKAAPVVVEEATAGAPRHPAEESGQKSGQESGHARPRQTRSRAPKTPGGLRARNATEVEGAEARPPKETPGIKSLPPTPAMQAAQERGDWREPHPRDKYTVAAVEEALRSAAGVWSIAAIKLGTTYNTIKDYVKRYPYLREVLEEIEESTIDLAESKFISAIKSGEAWAVQMMLRTKGKKRGYTERTELTGPGGGPVRTATIDLSQLTDAQLDALDAAARAFAA